MTKLKMQELIKNSTRKMHISRRYFMSRKTKIPSWRIYFLTADRVGIGGLW